MAIEVGRSFLDSLEAWLDDGGDLVAHLGLRRARGKRAAPAIARLQDRNAQIRAAVADVNGTPTAKARELLRRLQNNHPSTTVLREGAVAPSALSERHLVRIFREGQR